MALAGGTRIAWSAVRYRKGCGDIDGSRRECDGENACGRITSGVLCEGVGKGVMLRRAWCHVADVSCDCEANLDDC